jgi:mRNA-degrading endonuclease RelE of RelBE toxin-antitoxin system
MKNLFIETSNFTKRVTTFLSDDALMELQKSLMADPKGGKVIPGCGGLRKIRFGNPGRGKGKRGGLRVIYLHIPEVQLVFLLDIYDKDTLEDLSVEQRKNLKQLADGIKEQVGW